jgi:hypothetical protein
MTNNQRNSSEYETHSHLLETPGETSRFEIKADVLKLHAADGRAILHFEAVYLY